MVTEAHGDIHGDDKPDECLRPASVRRSRGTAKLVFDQMAAVTEKVPATLMYLSVESPSKFIPIGNSRL